MTKCLGNVVEMLLRSIIVLMKCSHTRMTHISMFAKTCRVDTAIVFLHGVKNNYVPGSRYFTKCLFKILTSTSCPAGNEPLAYTSFLNISEAATLYQSPEPRNLWEYHFLSNGIGSLVAKSVQSMEHYASFKSPPSKRSVQENYIMQLPGMKRITEQIRNR